jgi:hypothetical protein
MHSFGLKPWEHDDVDEGKQILAGFVADDKEEAKEKEKAK